MAAKRGQQGGCRYELAAYTTIHRGHKRPCTASSCQPVRSAEVEESARGRPKLWGLSCLHAGCHKYDHSCQHTRTHKNTPSAAARLARTTHATHYHSHTHRRLHSLVTVAWPCRGRRRPATRRHGPLQRHSVGGRRLVPSPRKPGGRGNSSAAPSARTSSAGSHVTTGGSSGCTNAGSQVRRPPHAA